MGSDSDAPKLEPVKKIFEQFGVSWDYTVASAHRTPEDVEEFIAECIRRGCMVFICAAGMSAHLAGVVAAETIKPVIAVPLTVENQSALNGLDALLSMFNMPPGIPVATMGLDKAGAENAARFVVQMFAAAGVLDGLEQKVVDDRIAMRKKVEEKRENLRMKWGEPRQGN